MPAPKKPHGKILYLLIPSNDVRRSAEFYEEVFGWTIRETGDGLAFDDSVNQVHGRFTTQLEAVENPGFVLYIMVQNAEDTERRIVELGGEVTDAADRENFDILGTFRDPSGNLFGFYEMKPGDEEEEG